MLEARGKRVDTPCELAVHGVARAGGGRCMMRLIENEQGARAEFAKPVAKTGGIDFIRHERMGQEEQRARTPRVHGEAALAPHAREDIRDR